MRVREHLWRLPDVDPDTLGRLRGVGDLSPVLLRVLAARGFNDADSVQTFLSPSLDRLEPVSCLPGLPEAGRVIQSTVNSGGRIRIYGDYDCDGLSAAALLLTALRRLGATAVDCTLPNRLEEGYGLHQSAVRRAKQEGVELLITVDCGVTACAEADLARQLGLNLVITDHHEPGASLPVAHLVNPKTSGPEHPLRHLAGVGVALKLAQFLTGDLAPDWLDLVALGTVADVVPLRGDNRILVKEGLERMRSHPRPGLMALMESAGLSPEYLEAHHLAFVLGPRLNAVGRLGDPTPALNLLLAEDIEVARDLASFCEQANRRRKKIEEVMLREIERRLEEEPALMEGRALVMAGRDWHQGLLGLVAARVVEMTRRPTVLLTGREGSPGVLYGSGRSVEGLSLFSALREGQDLLLSFGGHDMAVGLKLREDNLEPLREHLDKCARSLSPENLVPQLRVDAEVSLDEVDPGLYESLRLLEPCGSGNPRPLLLARGRLAGSRLLGREGRHLELTLLPEDPSPCPPLRAVGFGMADRWTAMGSPERLDMVFSPTLNTFRGRQILELRLTDFRPPGRAAYTFYRNRLRRTWLELDGRHPGREKLLDIHQMLRRATRERGGMIELGDEAMEEVLTRFDRLSPAGLTNALQVLAELGLVVPMRQGERSVWIVCPAPPGGVDPGGSSLFLRGERKKEALVELGRNVPDVPLDRLVAALYGFVV